MKKWIENFIKFVGYIGRRGWEDQKHVISFPLHVSGGDEIIIGNDTYLMGEARTFYTMDQLWSYISARYR